MLLPLRRYSTGWMSSQSKSKSPRAESQEGAKKPTDAETPKGKGKDSESVTAKKRLRESRPVESDEEGSSCDDVGRG